MAHLAKTDKSAFDRFAKLTMGLLAVSKTELQRKMEKLKKEKSKKKKSSR